MKALKNFKVASWRGTTNTDGQVIGVSFNLADGTVVRLALDVCSARNLAESVAGFLDAYDVRTNVHSAISSGNPNVDGSPQEGQKV